MPSATECSVVQPSAELTSQVLSKASKIHNTKDHVEVKRNIRTVVVKMYNIKKCSPCNSLEALFLYTNEKENVDKLCKTQYNNKDRNINSEWILD